MTIKSEERQLEAKKREWKEGRREWDKQQRRFLRGCQKEMKKAFNWYFFYEAKDNGDRAYHILMWLALNFIFWKALGVI